MAARYGATSQDAALIAEQALQRCAYRLRHSGKPCYRCAGTKPVSSFSRDSRERDGLRRRCRACEAEAHAEKRRLADAERVAERGK